MKNILKSKFIQFMIMFFICIGFNVLTVNASDTDGELLDVYPIPGISFSDHTGMKASIHGNWLYCVQRGYPFRSMCSEMQMCRGYYDTQSTTGGYTDPDTNQWVPVEPIDYEGKLSEIVSHMNDTHTLDSGKALWWRG